jgi:trimeric autotransporter adhesin
MGAWGMRGWMRKRARNPIGTAAGVAALLLVVSAGSAAGAGAARPWGISTLAGGVGGPGPASQIAGGDCAVAFRGGSLYATGFTPSVIRRISMRTGQLTTVAGTAFYARPSPDGTPATKASSFSSCGVTTDARGDLYFTDEIDLVEMVPATTGSYFGRAMTAGREYVIAGNGTDGYSGDGGPAVDAELSVPAGLSVDPAGNVIIDDSANNVVRIIAARSGTFYGRAMAAGDIYTVAGGGTDQGHSGIPATSALLQLADEYTKGDEYTAVLPWPLVTEDQAGNIVMDDGGGAPGPALVEVVADRTGTFYGQAMKAGDIYVIGGGGRVATSGRPATQVNFGISSGITLDHEGNILLADAYRHHVDVIAVTAGRFYGRTMKAGDAYILAGNGKEGLAGDGGPALKAEFSGPDGLTVDSAGNIVLADGEGGGYTAVFDNGRLRVIAARTGTFYGVKMKSGDIYTISGARGHFYYGDGGPAGRALLYANSFDYPQTGPGDVGVAATRSGGVVFADLENNRIRIVPKVAGTYFARRLRAGDIYTIAGDGRPGDTGNGGPATRARLLLPAGVAVDAAGNVLVADTGNNRVRIVAARSGRFYGQAMKAGHIYALAGAGPAGDSGDGGPARLARLNGPAGLAVDHHGNVVVCDRKNARIRVIAARQGRYYGRSMRPGRIYLASRLTCNGVAVDAAGNLVAGTNGHVEVVAARTGQFYGRPMVAGRTYVIGTAPAGLSEEGVAIDGSGNVIVATPDTTGVLPTVPDGLVQVIAARTGTFYGMAMTAGHQYTIAGAGAEGLGDGGPALRGRFSLPTGVGVAPSGALLVLDLDRIRVIRG